MGPRPAQEFKMLQNDKKTICALASGAGNGAIAILRISGSDTEKIIKSLCPGLEKKKLESHRVYLTKAKNANGETIDEVLITFFETNKSYTGEMSAEISCHGSSYIVKTLLSELVRFGARQAERGEFTFRAFMNDRIDLVQAEAVLSVIESQSEGALRVALRQLDGQVSKDFLLMESELIWCLAHIEASIDFSTEGLDVIDNQVLIQKLEKIATDLKKKIDSFKSGQILKDGLKVSLLGQPNVGKSSLLNQLVQHEKAIVTDIPGTTRDIVEASAIYNGVKVIFSDTAGLRETVDVVEKIGVEKSEKEALLSDVCLFVFDVNQGLGSKEKELIKKAKSAQIYFIANKWDRVAAKDQALKKEETRKKLQAFVDTEQSIDQDNVLFVSALDSQCRDQLLQVLTADVAKNSFLQESILSSVRQVEMSEEAYSLVCNCIDELKVDLGSEFIAQTLKNALLSIQKILGHSFDDQIMDRVFKEFCIGK